MGEKREAIGVVVGRFQTPFLHSGHIKILQHAAARHEEVLVILGSSPMEGSRRNPLGFAGRKALLPAYELPGSYVDKIVEVQDHPSDRVWSEKVDAAIESAFPGRDAMLYGGRDSFIPHYHGKFKTSVMSSVLPDSATKLREDILKNPDWKSQAFRSGVIYAAERMWPQLYMTVDIAVVDPEESKLLLGRKHDGDLLCFPGGFVDPKDASLAAAASRELLEETGYGVDAGGEGGLEYVGSTLVDDWRYKGPDRIMTALFLAYRSFGTAGRGVLKASDDLASMSWESLVPGVKSSLRQKIQPAHRPLLDMLKKHLSAGARVWCF